MTDVKPKTIQIENNTAQTYMIQLSSTQRLQILPGININVPVRVLNHIKKFYSHYIHLIDSGLWQIKDYSNKKVYEDPNGITYVDDGGEKVPIVQAQATGKNLPLSTGTTFTFQQLRDMGINSTMSRKILNSTPHAGWKSKLQMQKQLELTEKQKVNLDKIDLPEK